MACLAEETSLPYELNFWNAASGQFKHREN